MKSIIAVNNLGFIGLKGEIPWKCKEDMQHFAKLTKQGKNETSQLLVGYNTSLTLPTLKDRFVNVAPRKNLELSIKDFDLIDWCIGGKNTYERFCHLFTELHISHIDDNTIGDCLFPDFTNLNENCRIINYKFKTN